MPLNTFATRVTIQTNRAQQQTLELQRQQSERAQAAKVTFHLESKRIEEPHNNGDGTSTYLITGGNKVHVWNASDTPIHVITIRQTLPRKRLLFEADFLGPTGATPVTWTLIEETDWPVSFCEMLPGLGGASLD